MRILGVLVLLFAFAAPVYADSVDWSAYVETNPSRRLTKTTGPEKPVVASVPSKAKPARMAKSKTKSHAKVKARAKRPSRRK